MNAHGEMVIRKPDAGNLLVRFDEGEGNPSLLYPFAAQTDKKNGFILPLLNDPQFPQQILPVQTFL